MQSKKHQLPRSLDTGSESVAPACSPDVINSSAVDGAYDYSHPWRIHLEHRCQRTLEIQLRHGVFDEKLTLETILEGFLPDQFGTGGWMCLLTWLNEDYLFDWFKRVCAPFEDTSPDVALKVSDDDLVQLRDLCASVLSHGSESAKLDAADEAFPRRGAKHDAWTLMEIEAIRWMVGLFLPGSGRGCDARPCQWALTAEWD